MSNLDELDNLDETTPVAQRWLSSFVERFEVADSQASPGSTLDAELASWRVQPLGCSPATRNWHADSRLIRSTVCPLLRICYQHHRHPRIFAPSSWPT